MRSHTYLVDLNDGTEPTRIAADTYWVGPEAYVFADDHAGRMVVVGQVASEYVAGVSVA